MQKNKALFAVKQAYSIKAQKAIIRQLLAIFDDYRLCVFSAVKRLRIGNCKLLPVLRPVLRHLTWYRNMPHQAVYSILASLFDLYWIWLFWRLHGLQIALNKLLLDMFLINSDYYICLLHYKNRCSLKMGSNLTAF